MPTITITLTDDELKKLALVATEERRGAEAQGAVFIAEALGLWHTKTPSPRAIEAKAARHRKVPTNGVSGGDL